MHHQTAWLNALLTLPIAAAAMLVAGKTRLPTRACPIIFAALCTVIFIAVAFVPVSLAPGYAAANCNITAVALDSTFVDIMTDPSRDGAATPPTIVYTIRATLHADAGVTDRVSYEIPSMHGMALESCNMSQFVGTRMPCWRKDRRLVVKFPANQTPYIVVVTIWLCMTAAAIVYACRILRIRRAADEEHMALVPSM